MCCRKLTQFVLPSLFLQMVQIGMDIRQPSNTERHGLIALKVKSIVIAGRSPLPLH